MSKMNIVVMGLAVGNLASIIYEVIEVRKANKSKAEVTDRLELEHGALVGLVISNIKAEVIGQMHDSEDPTEEIVERILKEFETKYQAVLTEKDEKNIEEAVYDEFKTDIEAENKDEE